MALLDAAADHAGASGEDPLAALAEVAHDVVLIGEADLDRQVIEEQVGLLGGQHAGLEVEQHGGKAGWLRRGRSLRAGPDRLGRGGLLRQLGRRPVGAALDQGEADVLLPAPDLKPLLLAQPLQRHRQQHHLLLVNHVDELAQALAEFGGEILRRGVAQCLARLPEVGAHLVVNGPHHLRRAADAVLFQEREQLVLLAQVVQIHQRDHLQQRLQLGLAPGQAVAAGRVAQALQQAPQLLGDLQQRRVLRHEGVHRVAGGHLRQRLIRQRVAEDLEVHVAEPGNLALGHTGVDQLLLHLGDLAGADVLDQLGEALLEHVRVRAGVQVGDDAFEDITPLLASQRQPLGSDRQLVAALPDYLGLDRAQQLIDIQSAQRRDLAQARRASQRIAQHRVLQPGVLRAELHQEVRQKRVLPEQVKQLRLRCQVHRCHSSSRSSHGVGAGGASSRAANRRGIVPPGSPVRSWNNLSRITTIYCIAVCQFRLRLARIIARGVRGNRESGVRGRA